MSSFDFVRIFSWIEQERLERPDGAAMQKWKKPVRVVLVVGGLQVRGAGDPDLRFVQRLAK